MGYEKKDNCMVCGTPELSLTRPASSTLQELLDYLGKDPNYQLSRTSITGSQGVVFVQNPKPLRALHEYKLTMSLEALTKADPPVFMAGEDLIVTDPTLPTKLTLRVQLS